jgi:hypothetical protein
LAAQGPKAANSTQRHCPTLLANNFSIRHRDFRKRGSKSLGCPSVPSSARTTDQKESIASSIFYLAAVESNGVAALYRTAVDIGPLTPPPPHPPPPHPLTETANFIFRHSNKPHLTAGLIEPCVHRHVIVFFIHACARPASLFYSLICCHRGTGMGCTAQRLFLLYLMRAFAFNSYLNSCVTSIELLTTALSLACLLLVRLCSMMGSKVAIMYW